MHESLQLRPGLKRRLEYSTSSTQKENASMPPANQWAWVYSMASTWSKICTETVRVTPGMLPPIINTTPNSPTVWAKPRIEAVTKHRPRQRQHHAEKGVPGTGAQGGGYFQRTLTDGFEGVLQGCTTGME